VALSQLPGALQIEIPATADRLMYVRRRLSAWLRSFGLPETTAHDIVLAVDEACTNSIEHAYSGDAGIIRIDAEPADNQIKVKVADSGVWREPAEKRTRGRGLRIMEALSERLDLFTSDAGTTVQMSFGLTAS
jgi:anti-sigma regulatory factor (Ser/Thr protein kinase)